MTAVSRVATHLIHSLLLATSSALLANPHRPLFSASRVSRTIVAQDESSTFEKAKGTIEDAKEAISETTMIIRVSAPPKRILLPIVTAAAVGIAHRCGVLPTRAQILLRGKAVAGAVVGAATSPIVVAPLQRAMIRLIDFGVPAIVVVVALAGLSSDDDEDEDESVDGEGGGGLLRLLKGKGKESKFGEPPPKALIKIERLSDRYDSFAYSLSSATASKADALAVVRRRRLQRRFHDDLGSLSDTALAGVASAEASWRKASAANSNAVEAARAEPRSLSVKLGGGFAAPAEVDASGDGAGSSEKSATKRSEREHKKLSEKVKKAEEKLSKAQKKGAQLEAAFLQAASAALGPEHWEARSALAALAARPPSWDPRASPLEFLPSMEHRIGNATATDDSAPPAVIAPAARAFILDFPGDVQASSVVTLREEVTAIVGTASAERGDRVVLRLESGGGTVTGYGTTRGDPTRATIWIAGAPKERSWSVCTPLPALPTRLLHLLMPRVRSPHRGILEYCRPRRRPAAAPQRARAAPHRLCGAGGCLWRLHDGLRRRQDCRLAVCRARLHWGFNADPECLRAAYACSGVQIVALSFSPTLPRAVPQRCPRTRTL